MRNSVNRLVNCETANLNKTVSAAMKQVESIQLINQEIGLDNLPDRLREIAKLRVEHQEISLKELGEMISTGPISKSGVNHRLRKLNELADKIRSGENRIISINSSWIGEFFLELGTWIPEKSLKFSFLWF